MFLVLYYELILSIQQRIKYVNYERISIFYNQWFSWMDIRMYLSSSLFELWIRLICVFHLNLSILSIFYSFIVSVFCLSKISSVYFYRFYYFLKYIEVIYNWYTLLLKFFY